jgi:hypothetical protein
MSQDIASVVFAGSFGSPLFSATGLSAFHALFRNALLRPNMLFGYPTCDSNRNPVQKGTLHFTRQ